MRQVAASEDGRRIIALSNIHKDKVYCIEVGASNEEKCFQLPVEEVKQIHFVSNSDILITVAGDSASLWLTLLHLRQTTAICAWECTQQFFPASLGLELINLCALALVTAAPPGPNRERTCPSKQ